MAQARNFSLFQSMWTDSAAHPESVDAGVLSPQVKQSEHEND
jgi:hypothetical protein